MYNSGHFVSYAFDFAGFRLVRIIHMIGSSYAWQRSQLFEAHRLRVSNKKVAKGLSRKYADKHGMLYLGTYLWRKSPYHNDLNRLEDD